MNAAAPTAWPPGRWRVVIVDDEPMARRGVSLLLEREADMALVGEAADGPAAVERIVQEKPDIVFLDVQMPGCDGFEVLRRVGQAASPAVVFITAYDEHALRAFEVSAVDYLLKPYDNERFSAALQRAREHARRRTADVVDARLARLLDYLQHGDSTPSRSDGNGRILLKSSGEILFLKPEEIDWIEADGDYMKFHVAGRSHLMRETMARLEARLDPKRFVRIHRSTIVNVDRMRKLSPSFAGEYVVVLHDGTKLRLSRGYQDRIAALLKEAR